MLFSMQVGCVGDWLDWQDWKSGRNGRTGKTGSVLDRVILGPNPAIWEVWGLRFGTPGHHVGDLGVPGETLKGFGMIFSDFGSPRCLPLAPLGDHFSSLERTKSIKSTI